MIRCQVMDGFEMVRRYRSMESERLASAGRRAPLTIIGVSANSDLMAQARDEMHSLKLPNISNMSRRHAFSTCPVSLIFGLSQTICDNSVSQSLYLAAAAVAGRRRRHERVRVETIHTRRSERGRRRDDC
jgi:hypothetical protein